MDTIILAASTVSFFALFLSWLALPHASNAALETTHSNVESALVV